MGDCRFCGASEGVKINIFDPSCDYVSKIEVLLPLQMVPSETMPKVMCHRCMHKINEFYDFRRKCLSLDLKWRARLIVLDGNSTSAPVPPVKIKIEPPDSPIEIISESILTSSTANCGWSYTSKNDLPNYGAAVTPVTTDKLDQKMAVDVVTIEECKSKYDDPGKAVPQNNTANNTTNKDATSPPAKLRKKPGRKKGSVSSPKDLKHKRNEKKTDVKNDTKSDRKKSVHRTAVMSTTLPENTTLTTSHIKMPLQVTLNPEVQKVSASRTPLPEKAIKSAKVQKHKLNVESASLSPQTSSKEPANHTASQVKTEKQTAAVSSKISPRNHQKVTSLELPKPPTDSEKPLPPHIIMTSIPNVCTIFTCSLCERTFTSRSLACCHTDCIKMKKNISSNKTDESGSAEGIYACSHCDMKFTRYASLVPHEETHGVNRITEDSDTLSSSSDEETSRKRKKKRSSPVEIDVHKSTANAFA